MNRFELEGKIYYQQGRKCGRKTCACATGGPLHGPYWYSREHAGGKVDYIGRELPEAVEKAREARVRLFVRMGWMRRDREEAAAKLLAEARAAELEQRVQDLKGELDRAHQHAERLEERINGLATLDARLRALEQRGG